MHLDCDEMRLPPRPDTTLAEAFAELDADGYNAVNFNEFTFIPTQEAPDHDHPRFQETMRRYYPYKTNIASRAQGLAQARRPTAAALPLLGESATSRGSPGRAATGSGSGAFGRTPARSACVTTSSSACRTRSRSTSSAPTTTVRCTRAGTSGARGSPRPRCGYRRTPSSVPTRPTTALDPSNPGEPALHGVGVELTGAEPTPTPLWRRLLADVATGPGSRVAARAPGGALPRRVGPSDSSASAAAREPEIHVFVLWSNALVQQKRILGDIADRVRRPRRPPRDAGRSTEFSRNLTRFYGGTAAAPGGEGASLRHRSVPRGRRRGYRAALAAAADTDGDRQRPHVRREAATSPLDGRRPPDPREPQSDARPSTTCFSSSAAGRPNTAPRRRAGTARSRPDPTGRSGHAAGRASPSSWTAIEVATPYVLLAEKARSELERRACRNLTRAALTANIPAAEISDGARHRARSSPSPRRFAARRSESADA